MTYDDVNWHPGHDFPYGLEPEAAATPTGMFLAWAHLSGLGDNEHLEDNAPAVQALQARTLSPGRYYLDCWDGRLTDDVFTAEGNAFAQAYFDLDTGHFLRDYIATVVQELPSHYHVPDTWQTYQALKPRLDHRLALWRAAKAGQD